MGRVKHYSVKELGWASVTFLKFLKLSSWCGRSSVPSIKIVFRQTESLQDVGERLHVEGRLGSLSARSLEDPLPSATLCIFVFVSLQILHQLFLVVVTWVVWVQNGSFFAQSG